LSPKRGFTLIELLIVVIILSILASLVIPRLAGRTEEARTQASHADIEGGIAVALDLYEMDIGRYPASLDDLIRKPPDATRWKGPYLKKKRIPLDPWKNPYQYRYPGTHNDPGYDLYSKGSDGVDGSEDDITNWTD
jgi:general secretion pathway protein G